MKIARVHHIRCSEYDGCTLLWVPDDWDQIKLEEAVTTAKKRYLEWYEEHDINDKPPNDYQPHRQPDFKSYPQSMSIGDILASHAKKKAEWEAWNDEHRKHDRSFEEWLHELYSEVNSFWKYDPELQTDVSWGHRHGTKLRYATDPRVLDMYPSGVPKSFSDG